MNGRFHRRSIAVALAALFFVSASGSADEQYAHQPGPNEPRATFHKAFQLPVAAVYDRR